MPAAPQAPSGLSASAGDNRVFLTWGSANTASGYNVKRATTDNGPYSIIAAVTTTTHVDTTAVNDTTYYYVVSGTSFLGGEGENSTQVSVTPALPAATIMPTTSTGGRILWTMI